LAQSLETLSQEQQRKPASRPREVASRQEESSPRDDSVSPVARAQVEQVSPPVAAAAAAAVARKQPSSPPPVATKAAPKRGSTPVQEEYPAVVQEMVMNGFELRKVVHAYELVGDNFDDLLSLLVSNPNM